MPDTNEAEWAEAESRPGGGGGLVAVLLVAVVFAVVVGALLLLFGGCAPKPTPPVEAEGEDDWHPGKHFMEAASDMLAEEQERKAARSALVQQIDSSWKMKVILPDVPPDTIRNAAYRAWAESTVAFRFGLDDTTMVDVALNWLLDHPDSTTDPDEIAAIRYHLRGGNVRFVSTRMQP